MPARATQPAGYAAGQAQVQVTGAEAADVGSLEVCISGMLDAVETHLDPRLSTDAWTTAYAWFRPTAPRVNGPALLFDLDPAVTWHLRPHAPYVLRLRDAQGLRREERLTWVAIRLPSRAPQGYVPPPMPTPPAAAGAAAKAAIADAEAATHQEAARAAVEREAAAAAAAAQRRQKEDDEKRRQEEAEQLRRAQAEPIRPRPEPRIEQRGGKARILGGVVVALLLIAGIGGYVFKDDLFGASAPPVVAPSVPTTLDGARQFLARNPGADESFGLATRFLKEKQLDGAFLLLRNAAGKGNAAAALALGEMYDPDTYSADTSPLPAPNATQAAEWYRQAAEARIAEAQYRYGMLLISGKTAEPNGPELGIAWLRKAADQGLAKAKDALPK